MAVAYVPGRFKYVMKAEREAAAKGEKHTVFLLKALTSRELEELEGSMSMSVEVDVKSKTVGKQTGSQTMKPGERVNSFLRIALLGWEGEFKDAEGKDIEFKKEESTGMASWESIDNVIPYRYELYGAIEDGNTVSEAEGKNLR